MAESKYDEDIDDEIEDDGFKHPKPENELLPSHRKRAKQAGAQSYAINSLKTVKRSNDTDIIQICIGQIALLYEETGNAEDDAYRYGTGTAYMQLGNKYILIITCAHNLVYFDDKSDSKKKVSKLFFLPNGTQEQNNRLLCIEWIAHPKYNPRIDHCAYDIGVVLCYDPRKYYTKRGIDMEESIQIAQWNKKTMKSCCIFGYPVRGQGKLMGTIGKAKKDEKNEGRFYYEDIYTFPGQSGSVLYREDDDEEDVFVIYGIHIFGDVVKQFNRAVQLSEDSIKWIKSQESAMEKVMETHIDSRKKRTEKASDLKRFLDSLGLGSYFKNFTDRGCDKLEDLEDVDSDELLNEFVITEYKARKKILRGIKAHLGNNESAKSEQARAEKDRLAQLEQRLKMLENDNLELRKSENEKLQRTNEQKRQRQLERERVLRAEKTRLQKSENEMKTKSTDNSMKINDSFDPNCCHNHIRLSKNNSVATQQGDNDFVTVYLSHIVKRGVYVWRFKMVKQDGLQIGVWKTNHAIMDLSKICSIRGKSDGECYAFITDDALLTEGDAEALKRRKYGKICETNDIIEMRLDLNKKEIEYKINGKSMGIAYKHIEKTSYRAVVTMYAEGEVLELREAHPI